MESVYSMAFLFVEKAINNNMYVEADVEGFYNNVVKQFNVMLDGGMTSEQLIKNINSVTNVKVTKDTNLYRLLGSNEKENLLKANTFYYHNLLRVLPSAPRIEWDINTGEIVTIQEPLFLEMRASITADQIVEYYCKCFDRKVDKSSASRYKGSIKYMVEKLGVDMVLFMIDTAADIILTEDLQRPSSPVGIGEYEDTARERYFAKISENRVSEDDKIVIKQRVLPSRVGREKSTRFFHEEYDNYC